MELVIFVLVLAALATLAVAAQRAFPAVSWNSGDENVAIRQGRRMLVVAIVLLAAPVVLLAANDEWVIAILVALPGVGCGLCAVFLPHAFLGALVFLALAPVALTAAIASLP